MVCPRCGTENRASATFCTSCSYRLIPEEPRGESPEPGPPPPDRSPPSPTRRGGPLPITLIGWAVALIALTLLVLMTVSRAGLSSEAIDLRDRVEDQEVILRARQTDIEALRKANEDMEHRVEVCQKTARTSEDAYNLWIDLVSNFDTEGVRRTFTKLFNFTERWDRANTRCLAQ
jgi:hypothetical protein